MEDKEQAIPLMAYTDGDPDSDSDVEKDILKKEAIPPEYPSVAHPDVPGNPPAYDYSQPGPSVDPPPYEDKNAMLFLSGATDEVKGPPYTATAPIILSCIVTWIFCWILGCCAFWTAIDAHYKVKNGEYEQSRKMGRISIYISIAGIIIGTIVITSLIIRYNTEAQ